MGKSLLSSQLSSSTKGYRPSHSLSCMLRSQQAQAGNTLCPRLGSFGPFPYPLRMTLSGWPFINSPLVTLTTSVWMCVYVRAHMHVCMRVCSVSHGWGHRSRADSTAHRFRLCWKPHIETHDSPLAGCLSVLTVSHTVVSRGAWHPGSEGLVWHLHDGGGASVDRNDRGTENLLSPGKH